MAFSRLCAIVAHAARELPTASIFCAGGVVLELLPVGDVPGTPAVRPWRPLASGDDRKVFRYIHSRGRPSARGQRVSKVQPGSRPPRPDPARPGSASDVSGCRASPSASRSKAGGVVTADQLAAASAACRLEPAPSRLRLAVITTRRLVWRAAPGSPASRGSIRSRFDRASRRSCRRAPAACERTPRRTRPRYALDRDDARSDARRHGSALTSASGSGGGSA